MSGSRRSRYRESRCRRGLLALLLLVVAFAGGCGSAKAADVTAVKEISVTVVAGQVTPPADRVPVVKGQTVRITVRSDVSDVVHVHGFDVSAALSPDKAATVEFVADTDGLYEVETHVTKLQLLQLVVS